MHLLPTFFGSIPVIEQGNFGRTVKTAFSVFKETVFEKKNVLENKWNFLSFPDTQQKFSASCLFFSGFVKTAFYASIGTFSRKKHFSKHTLFHYLWTKNGFFSRTCRKKFGGVIKIEFCRSKEKLLRQFFLTSFSSNLFRTLTESLLAFC